MKLVGQNIFSVNLAKKSMYPVSKFQGLTHFLTWKPKQAKKV